MALDADDIAQIINLGHKYNDAADRNDPHAWTQTYTPEGELRSPLGNPKGHDALFDWISTVAATLSGTRHCALNEVIDGEGDHATMRSSYLVIQTNAAPPTISFTGGYDDELMRVDGRWRFVRRIHTLDPSDGGVVQRPPT